MKIPRGWKARLLDSHRMASAAGGIVSSHGRRAERILQGATYATVFAYLWRRFGPPPTGWDDYKELVCYYLTTPVKGIGFGISCCPAGLSYGVYYALDRRWVQRTREWEERHWQHWLTGFGLHYRSHSRYELSQAERFATGHVEYNEFADASPSFQARARRLVREYTERAGPCPDIRHVHEYADGDLWRLDSPPTPLPTDELPRSPHRTILEAIEAGLWDLLRPVPVRDTYINACGKLPEMRTCGSYRRVRAIAHSPRAGYGCSPEFIDAGEDWWRLSSLIEKKGVTRALIELGGQPHRKSLGPQSAEENNARSEDDIPF